MRTSPPSRSPLRALKDWLLGLFHSPSTRLVRSLRRHGVSVGEGVIFRDARSVTIDLTRPSLIEIGDHVDINAHFTIMTHDYATGVFLRKYGTFVNSSGKVRIGSNIYIGRNVTVLKGVHIGDNCVIALGSVVTRDIPANSVAAGCPARVIASLDDYYARRCRLSPGEAFAYARSIRDRFGRRPVPADFWEEFPLFVHGSAVGDYPELPIRRQLGPAYASYKASHRAAFDGFEAFLAAALADERPPEEERQPEKV